MTAELAVIEQKDIVSVFTTENGVDVLFDRLANEVRAEVPDLTTKKGRDRIASLAYKVSKSKGVVDEHGKELVSAEKARLALIDADRKKWRDKCDALRDEIRKPLTDWENEEKQRIETHESNIGLMQCLANVDGLHSDLIKARLVEAENIEVGLHWQEFAIQAAIAKDTTIKALKASLAARLRHEAEQAELELLRQQAIENQRIERERLIAENAARQAKEEAERLAKAEFERTERARIEAENKQAQLLRDAELAKQREINAIESSKREAEQAKLREQAAIDAAKEAAKRAEIEKAQAIEAEKNRAIAQALREKQQQEAEDAARLANINHRKKINNETLKSFTDNGIGEDCAKSVMALIAKGLIKNVTIKY